MSDLHYVPVYEDECLSAARHAYKVGVEPGELVLGPRLRRLAVTYWFTACESILQIQHPALCRASKNAPALDPEGDTIP